jgi:hypothetical protein
MIPFVPKKPTAVIAHPGNKNFQAGELSVIVEKPSRFDQEVYRLTLAEFEKFEPAINPENGKPFLDATGAVRALRLPVNYPLAPTMEFLEKLIRDVSGLSENGQPLKLDPKNAKQVIWYLAEPLFDVPVTRQVPVLDEKGEPKKDKLTGEPVTEGKQIELAYPIYLLERLNEEDTFADPLGRPAPATPSSDSSSVS